MSRRPRLATTALLLAAALLVGACSSAAVQPSDVAARTIRVATTTGMVADAVRNVGGDRVEVSALMGPGVDPHLYKPTASDVGTLDDADVIVYSGLHLEGRMTDLFEGVRRTGKPTFAAAEAIDPARLRTPPEFDGQHDPHVWFDVSLWQEAVDGVRHELARVDPASAEAYARNAVAYLAELDALDAYVRDRAAEVPASSRVLITAHDAFGYFGAAYGFEVRGLQGTSTSTEAGAGDVQFLARFICQRGVRALFVESSIPRRTIGAVQEAARAQGCEVGVGGQLFSDAMGDEGTPEGTYVGMVRHNIDTIVEALRLT
ncbi:MAG: manganese transporter [Acidimicrobiia bacterium]|nr:manganese transporter [Acidimicrobiia bacterium]